MNAYLFAQLNNIDKKVSIYLEAYELTQGAVTGYKVYHAGEQVATLEFRGSEWIAATLIGFKIQTMMAKEFKEALYWIEGVVS